MPRTLRLSGLFLITAICLTAAVSPVVNQGSGLRLVRGEGLGRVRPQASHVPGSVLQPFTSEEAPADLQDAPVQSGKASSQSILAMSRAAGIGVRAVFHVGQRVRNQLSADRKADGMYPFHGFW